VAAVIRAFARDGARDVVVVPVGFVCDHVEVLYDLDVEAKAVAESSGIGFHRAAAANDHPAFVAMLADVPAIRRAAREILDAAAGRPGHVFNLGHGIHKDTPVERVKALVDIVHELSAR
ncbi:MAG TPA: ferrochelatase, partial [Methylomirabilota bacterium]|nr:ferrochelatase [Methylomirabilota bacterium]